MRPESRWDAGVDFSEESCQLLANLPSSVIDVSAVVRVELEMIFHSLPNLRRGQCASGQCGIAAVRLAGTEIVRLPMGAFPSLREYQE